MDQTPLAWKGSIAHNRPPREGNRISGQVLPLKLSPLLADSFFRIPHGRGGFSERPGVLSTSPRYRPERISTMLDRSVHQLRQRLKNTGLALGLMRLQLDAGASEEAKQTLQALQGEFQVLLHGVEGETKNSFASSVANPTNRRIATHPRKRFDPSPAVPASARENSNTRCRV